MDLINIENLFNQHYNFDALKQHILESAKKLIDNWENNYLYESKDELPSDLTFKDLKIEYSCIHLIINNNDRNSPFFRVCVQLNNPNSGVGLYTYEIEYSINGEICDDYFLKL